MASLLWLIAPIDAFLFAAVVLIIAVHWPSNKENKKIDWRAKNAWMLVVFGLISLAMREILSTVERLAELRNYAIPTSIYLLDEIPALFAAIFFIFAAIVLFKSNK